MPGPAPAPAASARELRHRRAQPARERAQRGGRSEEAAPPARRWRVQKAGRGELARLAAGGFHGRAWVTEHGYQADTTYQWDPDYRGGAAAQAPYLAALLPRLLEHTQRVFVTWGDARGGPWASEGLLTGSVRAPPQ